MCSLIFRFSCNVRYETILIDIPKNAINADTQINVILIVKIGKTILLMFLKTNKRINVTTKKAKGIKVFLSLCTNST